MATHSTDEDRMRIEEWMARMEQMSIQNRKMIAEQDKLAEETAKLREEQRKTMAETAKLWDERSKTLAETAKIRAEERHVAKDYTLRAVAIAATFGGALVAAGGAIWSAWLHH